MRVGCITPPRPSTMSGREGWTKTSNAATKSVQTAIYPPPAQQSRRRWAEHVGTGQAGQDGAKGAKKSLPPQKKKKYTEGFS